MSEKEVNPAPDAGTVTQAEEDVEAHSNPPGVVVEPDGGTVTKTDDDVEAHVLV